MSSEARTAILNAAGEVFARFGFKKASMEDIARRAGVGKGSLYLHFESKEALFEAVLRLSHGQSLAELEAAVRRASAPASQVRAFIHCKLDQVSRLAAAQRFQLETIFDLGTEALRLIPELAEKEAALLARTLAEGNAQGAFAVPEPQQVAMGLMEAFTGLNIKLLTQGPNPAFRDAMDAYFDVFIRGLAAPPLKS